VHLYADVVWPALFLEQQMLSIVPITVGLLVECIALRYGGFGLSWKRAAQVDLSMNAVSTFAGMFLLPLAGVSVIFAPGSWAWPLTVVMAVLVTTLVEAGVVRFAFKIELNRKRWLILGAANMVSVGIALASVWMHPYKH